MTATPRDLYDEVILDHSKQPRNFGPLANHTHHADGRNPICGDEISVYLDLDELLLKGIAFSGQGCAISKASASLMTEDLKNCTIAQIKDRAEEIMKLLTEESESDAFAQFGGLAALTGVRSYPARVKCATLPWHTVLAALSGKFSASTE